MPIIETVYLNVADLERMVTFYENTIGLRVRQRTDSTVHLGAGGDDLVVLNHTPERKRYPGTTGLYHLALLVPTRLDLARSLQHLIDTRTRLQGASDHIVSEAVYLPDPEGNGIEIYRDRTRDEWFRDGQMQLATLPMDADGVLGELNGQDATFTGLPDGTIMGHIHLHVASVARSRQFYKSLLGLDVMFDVGSALFMSYEDYHHHIGANTWGGATRPPADALGLDHFAMRLPDSVSLDLIRERLAAADIPVAADGDHQRVSDPAGNVIALRG